MYDGCKCDCMISQGGADERNVPGNTIAVQADMPFSGLTKFGQAFLSKFECSQMPHPVCDNLIFPQIEFLTYIVQVQSRFSYGKKLQASAFLEAFFYLNWLTK